MRRLDALYPRYGFARHVGYITPGHSAAVRAHGPSDQHRLSFNALAYAASRMPRNPDERRAARHYRLRGYRILGANVWAGGYELDLIVRRGRKLVFAEVKGKTRRRLRRPARDGRTPRSCGACGAPPRRGSHAIPECRELDCRFEVVAVRVGGLSASRFNAPSTRCEPARGLRCRGPEGTIPERARSSGRLRPGRAGLEPTTRGGRNFRLNPRSIIQPERNVHTTMSITRTRFALRPGPGRSSPRSRRSSSGSAASSAARRGSSSSPGSPSSSTSSMFWFSAKFALKASKARPVERSEAPELYRDVEEIAGKAGVPMPAHLPDPVRAAERVRDRPQPEERRRRGHRGSPAVPAARPGEGRARARDGAHREPRHPRDDDRRDDRRRDLGDREHPPVLDAVRRRRRRRQPARHRRRARRDHRRAAGGHDPPARRLAPARVPRRRDAARAISARAGRSPRRSERSSAASQAVPMNVNPATESLYIANPLSGKGMRRCSRRTRRWPSASAGCASSTPRAASTTSAKAVAALAAGEAGSRARPAAGGAARAAGRGAGARPGRPAAAAARRRRRRARAPRGAARTSTHGVARRARTAPVRGRRPRCCCRPGRREGAVVAGVVLRALARRRRVTCSRRRARPRWKASTVARVGCREGQMDVLGRLAFEHGEGRAARADLRATRQRPAPRSRGSARSVSKKRRESGSERTRIQRWSSTRPSSGGGPLCDRFDAVPVRIADEGAVVLGPYSGRGPGEPSLSYPAAGERLDTSWSTCSRERAAKPMWSRCVTGRSGVGGAIEKSFHSQPQLGSRRPSPVEVEQLEGQPVEACAAREVADADRDVVDHELLGESNSSRRTASTLFPSGSSRKAA